MRASGRSDQRESPVVKVSVPKVWEAGLGTRPIRSSVSDCRRFWTPSRPHWGDRFPITAGGQVRTRQSTRVSNTEAIQVFFFFSNRLGCLGSLAISVIVTLILLAVFHRL